MHRRCDGLDGRRAPPTGSPPAAAGYRLAVVDPTFAPGVSSELRFTVIGPDGLPVTAFTPTPRDPGPLHPVVVRRDATGFQRLTPSMDPDGTWRAPVRSRPGRVAGVRRLDPHRRA